MSIMKDNIKLYIFKAAHKVELWVMQSQLKKSDAFRYVVISHAQIAANDLFEHNTLSENIDIAISAVNKLLNINKLSEKDKIHTEQVEQLTLKLEKNKDVLNLLTEYYLARSYSFSKVSLTDTTKYVNEHISKAKLLNKDIEPFNQQKFNSRYKEIKAERKLLEKQLNMILDNKITNEKNNEIEKFSFTKADVTVLFSLFSSLFLLSGYYYNHTLLSELNINSDDFYLLSDYISTSISLIITPLIWTAIFTFSFVLGANDNLNNRIIKNQLDIEINDKPRLIFPITIILFNIMGIFLLLNGNFELRDTMITVDGLIVSFYFITKLPFHYFKNPFKVFSYLVICIGFMSNLNTIVNRKVKNIISDDYQPKYLVKFNNKVSSNKSLEFIVINSNYIIMRNIDSKNMEIYPKSYIVQLNTNPNQTKELSLIDSIVEFIELHINIYEAIVKDSERT